MFFRLRQNETSVAAGHRGGHQAGIAGRRVDDGRVPEIGCFAGGDYLMGRNSTFTQTTSPAPPKWPASKIVYALLLSAGFACVAFFYFFMFRTLQFE